MQDWIVKFDGATEMPRGFGYITYINLDVATFVIKLGKKMGRVWITSDERKNV